MSEFEAPQLPDEIWQNLPPAVQQYIELLQTHFQHQITALQAQIIQLQTHLDQNSQNSSKPPSADPPYQRPPKKTKPKSGNLKGGQVGHLRHSRPLLPPEQLDLLKEWWPSQCQNCAGPLRPSDQFGQPLRHQVWEIPRVRATVTEHQLFSCECSACGTLTTHPHPPAVPVGNFGPNLTVSIASLHGRYRLSIREVQAVAAALWQVELSSGAIAQLCYKTSLALAPVYEQLKAQVHSSPVLNVDETGWYDGGQRFWLWVAVSRVAVVFEVTKQRSRASLHALIGQDYRGVVGSDHYNAYYGVAPDHHQLCWAHLLRNLRGLGERAGPAAKWSETALNLSQRLFACWHNFKHSQTDKGRTQLQSEVGLVRAEFKSHLEKGLNLGDGKVRAFCRQLLKHEDCLWVFSHLEGVEPTNNAAEQALRPAVIWRKTCFGTQSERGQRFVERMLSVSASCAKSGRNLFDFVSESLAAHWYGQPFPTLCWA